MSTRSRYLAGTQAFYDPQQNYEHMMSMAPLFYDEEFLGGGKAGGTIPSSATAGSDWVKKIVGAAPPTVGGVANAGGGQVACALTSTSEKQDAALYWGDQKALDVTKNLVMEIRVQLSVLPSAAGVQAVWGLSSAWIDGPDNAGQYLEFGATASGAILLRSQDGTTQKSIASGITVLATDWHVYRIEAIDPTDIRFYIDGVQVSANNAVPFAATGSSAILQPYMSVYKPSGTGVATLTVDYFRSWQNRQ
jgi:hypothetical protein